MKQIETLRLAGDYVEGTKLAIEISSILTTAMHTYPESSHLVGTQRELADQQVVLDGMSQSLQIEALCDEISASSKLRGNDGERLAVTDGLVLLVGTASVALRSGRCGCNTKLVTAIQKLFDTAESDMLTRSPDDLQMAKIGLDQILKVSENMLDGGNFVKKVGFLRSSVTLHEALQAAVAAGGAAALVKAEVEGETTENEIVGNLRAAFSMQLPTTTSGVSKKFEVAVKDTFAEAQTLLETIDKERNSVKSLNLVKHLEVLQPIAGGALGGKVWDDDLALPVTKKGSAKNSVFKKFCEHASKKFECIGSPDEFQKVIELVFQAFCP